MEWICEICGQAFKNEVDLLAHQFNSLCERELAAREHDANLPAVEGKTITISRREFAEAAADLAYGDVDSVVALDYETGKMRATRTPVLPGEVIIFSGDAGYCCPESMTRSDWIEFYLSDSFDWEELLEHIQEELRRLDF